MRVRPFRQACGRPAVVIGAVAAHIGHRVDRRRAADHLAARAFDASSVEARLRLALVHPVVAALLQKLPPAERQVDPRVAVPAAGLEHQHADIAVFGQPVRQRAAGRAGADDDIIECAGFHVAGPTRRSIRSRPDIPPSPDRIAAADTSHPARRIWATHHSTTHYSTTWRRGKACSMSCCWTPLRCARIVSSASVGLRSAIAAAMRRCAAAYSA